MNTTWASSATIAAVANMAITNFLLTLFLSSEAWPFPTPSYRRFFGTTTMNATLS